MGDREEELIAQRLEKLERLRANHIDPYPPRYPRTHTTQQAVALFEAQERAGNPHPPEQVSVAGRITALRRMGKASFLDIRDGSGRLQLHLRQDLLGEGYGLLSELDLGDFLGAQGPLFRTRTGEVTLGANQLTLLTKTLRPPPEKWHGLADVEKRYRQRYLDLMANEEVRSLFQLRSRMVSAIRRFMEARGFLEVETPVLVPVAAGAHARPFSTHHHALERNLYLRIATELYLKRLIVGGLDKVYEIGRVFRNEGISFKHNPEYTLMESYQAYADYNDVMKMVEELVHTVAREVLGTSDIQFQGQSIDLAPPWRRVTLREAIQGRSGIDIEAYPEGQDLSEKLTAMGLEVNRGESRGRLIDKLLSSFVEPTLLQPTFVIDYPVEMSPLAKRKPEDPRYVERFEGFIAGMEMTNSFTELNDPLDQRQRLVEQERLRQEMAEEEAERLDDDFLLALEHGMPPTGGLGLGIDRMAMVMTGRDSIREVILFPQLREK